MNNNSNVFWALIYILESILRALDVYSHNI